MRTPPPVPPRAATGVLAAGLLLLFALQLLPLEGVLAPPSAWGEDEPASLSRALFLEKTARDPKAALAAFHAVANDPALDATTRSEGLLGEARCLLALDRETEAIETWKRLEADVTAPAAAKEEARTRREERAAAHAATLETEAAAKNLEAIRHAEEARREGERRIAVARKLVEAASSAMREKRYEKARENLIQALELNPNDERAAQLLEELGSYADRGELLRQAIRFVATNRVADYRRLRADVERLRKAGMRALLEEKPGLAAKPFAEAIERIDKSDFYADLGDTRRELMAHLKKALGDAQSRGIRLDQEVPVPAEKPEEPATVKAWRGEFFALLGKIFTSGGDPTTALRFFDTAIPPDASPDARSGGFASSGIGASKSQGSLRRARWLERYLRNEVAAGTWTGPDRLLERYDDLLVVQHASGVLRDVDALLNAFPPSAPQPATVEVRVYGAEPGGVADALRALEARTSTGESGAAVVVKDRRIEEQVDWLSRVDKVKLLAQASVVLTGRHAAIVHFREPTSACPWYASKDPPPLVIPDRDATYGLDLDLYAEDLPGIKAQAALSVVATVRRPERPRTLPLPTGLARVPVFLSQTLEADRKVPHAGSLVLLGLTNPFLSTGAAGNLGGGSHPDLIVLVSVGRAPGSDAPDISPLPPVVPAPATVSGRVTRDYDLGALGTDVTDEPPPEDWPRAAFGDAARLGAARAQRDAFLGGWLLERAAISPTTGAVVVKDGRAGATLLPAEHARLAKEVEILARDEARVFTVEIRSTEVPADRAAGWLAEAGARSTSGDQRLWVLDPSQASRLEERLKGVPETGSLFATEARIAARHTQLVTTRAIRTRSIVEEFKVVRGEGDVPRTVPVNGTAEEGLLVAVRPLASVGGLVIFVNAILARIERMDSWTPPEVPGDAPTVTLPRHRTEVAAGYGTIGEKDTLLLAVPAPGSDGNRVVLVRVRILSASAR